MTDILMSRFRRLHAELGIAPHVINLVSEAYHIHPLEKRMRERLKEMSKQAENLDYAPEGYLIAEDAESLFGTGLRSLMIEWMEERNKSLRFDYVADTFTPLIEIKALVRLLGEPKFTSVSIEARKAGIKYSTMYYRLRVSGCPFHVIRSWRGGRINAYRTDAVTWEKDGWEVNGHLSNSSINGRSVTPADTGMRVKHGFEQVRLIEQELERRRKRGSEKIEPSRRKFRAGDVVYSSDGYWGVSRDEDDRGFVEMGAGNIIKAAHFSEVELICPVENRIDFERRDA